MVKLIEYRQLASILTMFLIVQLAGLLIVFYLVSPAQAYIGTTGSGGSVESAALYFIAIVLFAVALMVLLRRYRGPLLFKGMEALMVVSASFYLFIIVLSSLFPNSLTYDLIASIAGAVLLIAAKNRWLSLQNFTTIVASVGAGLVLGIYFGFLASYIFMAFVAVYDYVAVFVTKHMIVFAREALRNNLSIMVVSSDVGIVPNGYLKPKEAAMLKKEFKNTHNETLKRLIASGNVPMPSMSALGGGDLIIPLMVAVGAYVSYLNYFFSVVIAIAACFGLVFSMWVSKRYGIGLPAIPPLFAFVSAGFGINVLLTTPTDWPFYLALFAEGIVVLAIILTTAMRQKRNAALKITGHTATSSRS